MVEHERWRQATEEIVAALGREMSPLGYSQSLEEAAVEVKRLLGEVRRLTMLEQVRKDAALNGKCVCDRCGDWVLSEKIVDGRCCSGSRDPLTGERKP